VSTPRGGPETGQAGETTHAWGGGATDHYGEHGALDAPTHHVGPPPDEGRTQTMPVATAPPRDGDDSGGDDGDRPWWKRRPALLGAAVVGLLLVLYVGDLVFSSTDVPRGVSVAGVEIGGMSKPDAEAALRSQLEPRLNQPVQLRAGDASASLDPREAGLQLDLDQTIAQAGEQPLNPFTRVSSLFSTRDLPPATTINAFTVTRTLEGMRPELDRPAVEGGIRFQGAQPVGIPSRPGQRIDTQAGTQAIAQQWLNPAPVILPTTALPVTVTPESVQQTIDQVARPATAGPAYVLGVGANAVLSPEDIGKVLVFRPDGSGGLTPSIDQKAAVKIVEPQLKSTEADGKDATYDFAGGNATVVPSVVGRQINWDSTFSGMLGALAQPAGAPAPAVYTPPPAPPGQPPPDAPPLGGRTVSAAYETKQPKVTTDQLKALGPATIIGEFQTNGFATDSGQNIKRVAEQVNGAVVAPNSVFSLNGFTGPRDAAQGYVDAGIIEDGLPARGVGGGISQFATTLYNASYFAGMEDVEHKEHSYYISRYPAGREATVFEGAIDLKFKNTGPTPVLIRTTWTPSSIKVQLYGQKRYDVTSTPGPRTNPVPRGATDRSDSPNCKPAAGVDGFTVTDTRTLKDIKTGQVTTEPRTVKYEPEPKITCGGG
jgi:vancomycin resistance protein YoaR